MQQGKTMELGDYFEEKGIFDALWRRTIVSMISGSLEGKGEHFRTHTYPSFGVKTPYI